MSYLDTIIEYLPEVRAPKQKKPSFKEKLRWTLVILVSYFLMTHINIYGLGEAALAQFEFLSTILGASFGSLVSLGIGPIVTASIVLQLLNGSGIVNFDLTSAPGKKRFQGLQKILAIFFTLVEATVFVLMGGISPAAGINPIILIVQLFIGGIFIIFMDEIVSKYGFGSGVSLFIAAGVSQEIVIQLLSPLPQIGESVPVGIIPFIFYDLVFSDVGVLNEVQKGVLRILSTLAVFAVVVYASAMKVEIPLSFGRVKGHGVRWPLKFLYSNVIPIIFVAALSANVQLLARLFSNQGNPILGTFDGGQPASGLVYLLSPVNLVDKLVDNTWIWADAGAIITYVLFYVIGSTIFSIFWVQSSGLDAKSQAKQMVSSGLQVPGFRRDIRVLERLLKRYINPLAVLGGIAIGVLASVADLTAAVGTGTGILLTVMIVYRLYEEIAKQHVYEMNPALRKFMGE